MRYTVKTRVVDSWITRKVDAQSVFVAAQLFVEALGERYHGTSFVDVEVTEPAGQVHKMRVKIVTHKTFYAETLK